MITKYNVNQEVYLITTSGTHVKETCQSCLGHPDFYLGEVKYHCTKCHGTGIIWVLNSNLIIKKTKIESIMIGKNDYECKIVVRNYIPGFYYQSDDSLYLNATEIEAMEQLKIMTTPKLQLTK
jgi:hypothetical protein